MCNWFLVCTRTVLCSIENWYGSFCWNLKTIWLSSFQHPSIAITIRIFIVQWQQCSLTIRLNRFVVYWWKLTSSQSLSMALSLFNGFYYLWTFHLASAMDILYIWLLNWCRYIFYMFQLYFFICFSDYLIVWRSFRGKSFLQDVFLFFRVYFFSRDSQKKLHLKDVENKCVCTGTTVCSDIHSTRSYFIFCLWIVVFFI